MMIGWRTNASFRAALNRRNQIKSPFVLNGLAPVGAGLSAPCQPQTSTHREREQTKLLLIQIAQTYLHSCLGQARPRRYLLSGVDVRVMSFLEGNLEVLQLGAGKCGSNAPLLPVLVSASRTWPTCCVARLLALIYVGFLVS